MSIDSIFNALWAVLTPRQQDVLKGRFGLDKHARPKTLAALGTRYNITRERVRQIESAALHVLRQKMEANRDIRTLTDKARKFLKDHGGVASEAQLLEALKESASDITQNKLSLIVRATGAVHLHPADEHWHPFYYLDAASLAKVQDVVSSWIDALSKRKQDVLKGKYKALWTDFAKRKKLSPKQAEQYVSLSKSIRANAYGDVGLTDWEEIVPSTVRDQIYLVLKKRAEPLHFVQIAKAINQAGIAARPALAPTVHNELIKDQRFVLVGRGMYALAEHGYVPGNAREVIHRVLKRNGSLRPRDIILAVQKERFFKPNTILVNLQNKQYFERRSDGTYRVREA
jgi:hypothetical protein